MYFLKIWVFDAVSEMVNRNVRHKFKVDSDEEKKFVHTAGCVK
jgi:hypothetical protein